MYLIIDTKHSPTYLSNIGVHTLVLYIRRSGKGQIEVETMGVWRSGYLPTKVDERKWEEDGLVPNHCIQVMERRIKCIPFASLGEGEPCVPHIQSCRVPNFFEVVLQIMQSPVNGCSNRG